MVTRTKAQRRGYKSSKQTERICNRYSLLAFDLPQAAAKEDVVVKGKSPINGLPMLWLFHLMKIENKEGFRFSKAPIFNSVTAIVVQR
jgi:hypothetical protein